MDECYYPTSQVCYSATTSALLLANQEPNTAVVSMSMGRQNEYEQWVPAWVPAWGMSMPHCIRMVNTKTLAGMYTKNCAMCWSSLPFRTASTEKPGGGMGTRLAFLLPSFCPTGMTHV